MLSALALLGCATTLTGPSDVIQWDLHPDMVEGEVRVAPIVVVAEVPEPELKGLVGQPLDPWVAQGRLIRTAEVAELPYAFQHQVPGALYGALPRDWDGHFRDQDLTLSQRITLTHALGEDGRGISAALTEIAKERGGDATLFTWVVALDGVPLTREHMAGELVLMDDGMPVTVEHDTEPYRIIAEVGLALVSAEGEILFRYQDEYEGLLTDSNPLDAVARGMAHDAVGDIAPFWLSAPPSAAVARTE
jgi:hypothetical protein